MPYPDSVIPPQWTDGEELNAVKLQARIDANLNALVPRLQQSGNQTSGISITANTGSGWALVGTGQDWDTEPDLELTLTLTKSGSTLTPTGTGKFSSPQLVATLNDHTPRRLIYAAWDGTNGGGVGHINTSGAVILDSCYPGGSIASGDTVRITLKYHI